VRKPHVISCIRSLTRVHRTPSSMLEVWWFFVPESDSEATDTGLSGLREARCRQLVAHFERRKCIGVRSRDAPGWDGDDFGRHRDHTSKDRTLAVIELTGSGGQIES